MAGQTRLAAAAAHDAGRADLKLLIEAGAEPGAALAAAAAYGCAEAVRVLLDTGAGADSRSGEVCFRKKINYVSVVMIPAMAYV